MEGDLRTLGYLDTRGVLMAVKEINQYYESLAPSIEKYVTATEVVHLLAMSGTFPLPGRGKNVPAILWMPKQFPREPPLIYIQKPATCLINPASHLDLSGLVQHDYLRQWNHARSSLADFLQILIADFTSNLPIFSLEHFNMPLRVRDNIKELLRQFPEFMLDMEIHDGKEMLVIRGSLKSREMGIPQTRQVDVWLHENFPTGPPSVYVYPSDGHITPPGAKAYDQCRVDIQYLRDWHYNKSCLQILMNVVIIEFSETTSDTVPCRIHTPRPPRVPQRGCPQTIESRATREGPASDISVSISTVPTERFPCSESNKSKHHNLANLATSSQPNLQPEHPGAVQDSNSTSDVSGELLEFAAKAELSDDTLRRLRRHGFKNMRSVLGMNDGDLEALKLPEMAQKVLLRGGIKDRLHKDDDCKDHINSPAEPRAGI